MIINDLHKQLQEILDAAAHNGDPAELEKLRAQLTTAEGKLDMAFQELQTKSGVIETMSTEARKMEDEIVRLKERIAKLEDGEEDPLPVPTPEGEPVLFGHEMMAMAPNGDGTSAKDWDYRAEVFVKNGIVPKCFQPELRDGNNRGMRNAQALFDAMARAGGKAALAFAYCGMDLADYVREIITHFKDHPAMYKRHGLPYISAYHASDHMRTILDGLPFGVYYVPHRHARGSQSGKETESPTLAEVDACLAKLEQQRADGFATFYPLEDWRVMQKRWIDGGLNSDLEMVMSVTPKHEPVGHKGNWRVFEGHGMREFYEQFVLARAHREIVRDLEIVTLNDFSEGTGTVGFGEPALVREKHWNSADWPADLYVSGYASFAAFCFRHVFLGRPAPNLLRVWITYRLQKKDVSSGPVPSGKPAEWKKLEDKIFLTAYSKAGGENVVLNSSVFRMEAGFNFFDIPLKPGAVWVKVGDAPTFFDLPAVRTDYVGGWKSFCKEITT